MASSRLKRIVPYLALAALFFAFHREVYFQGKVYYNPWIFRNHAPFPKPDPALLNPLNPSTEYMTHYFPYKAFLAQCLREKTLPLWNPYTFCGFPIYANANTCVFSPLNLLLERWPPYRAYLGLLAAFFLAGSWLCYYFLVRFARTSGAAAFAGAASLLFSPHLVQFIDYDTTLAMVWAYPLVLIMAHRLRDSARAAPSAAFAFFAVILMGHMHVVVNALALFTLYFLFISGGLSPASRALRLAGVYAGFAGLAAFILWPTALFFRQSHWLAELGRNAFAVRLPLSLVTGLYPALTKIPLFEKFLSAATGGHFEFSSTFAVGSLPFLLGIAGSIAVFLRGVNRGLKFFAAWVLVYHVWTLLGFTDWMPGAVGQFLNVCFFKFWEFYVFATAVLAAYAVDAAAVDGPFRRLLRRVRNGFGLLVVLPMTAAGAAVWAFRAPVETRLLHLLQARGLAAGDAYTAGRFAEIFGTALRVLSPVSAGMAVPVLAVLGLGWALHGRARAATEPAARRTRSILLGLIVLELFWTGRGLLAVPAPADAVWPRTRVTDFLKGDPSLFRVMALQTTGKPGEGVQKYILKPNLGIPYGLYDVGGMDSMTNGAYLFFTQKYLTGKPEAPFSRYGQLDYEFVDPAVAGFLNVKYVLVSDARKLEENGLVPALTADGLTVYENRKNVPRIFFTRKIRPFRGFEDAYRSLAREPFTGEPWVHTENPNHLILYEPLGAEAAHPIIHSFSPQDVRLDIQTSEAGMLVWTDCFDAGWKATDGSKPVSIDKIDGLLTGLYLEPGAHSIRFVYRPDAFYRGLAASLFALIFLAAWRASGIRAPRRPMVK